MSGEPVEILLVEDNPDDADLTVRTLRKHNVHNVLHHAHDGEEALVFLHGAAGQPPPAGPVPKLVILDLKLPRVDGFDVLRAIRAHPRTRLIPVVVMTSSREEGDLVRSYELGTNSYVVKPIEFGEFAHAVAELGMYWMILNASVR